MALAVSPDAVGRFAPGHARARHARRPVCIAGVGFGAGRYAAVPATICPPALECSRTA